MRPVKTYSNCGDEVREAVVRIHLFVKDKAQHEKKGRREWYPQAQQDRSNAATEGKDFFCC
jgi:hypothetical protein